MPASSFGKKLRKLRLAAGMTQADLAKRARCNPVSISQYESGACEPRDERATMLIELVGGGSKPPEELKSKKPKKRGRPKKASDLPQPPVSMVNLALSSKGVRKAKRKFFRETVKPMLAAAAEKEFEDSRPILMNHDPKANLRLGSVSRAWIEQMVDSHVHARGAVIADGQVRVVTMRRADLIELAAELLDRCGTRVEEG